MRWWTVHGTLSSSWRTARPSAMHLLASALGEPPPPPPHSHIHSLPTKPPPCPGKEAGRCALMQFTSSPGTDLTPHRLDCASEQCQASARYMVSPTTTALPQRKWRLRAPDAEGQIVQSKDLQSLFGRPGPGSRRPTSMRPSPSTSSS